MRSRQVSLRAVALAHHAGIVRAGREPLVGDRLQRRDLVQHRRPAVVRRHRRRGAGGAGRRLDDGEDLPALDRVADGRAAPGSSTTPAQGAATDVSIFMALTTNSRSPAFTATALAHLDLDDGARMRAFDGLVPGRHRQRAGRRPRSPHRGRARGRRPAGRGTAARRACRLRRVDGFGEQGGARIARPELGMGQDGAQLVGGWSARRRYGTRRARAPGPVDRRVERARGARLADELGQQRIELRRRRQAEVAAGIDPHARPRRLPIGGERARALRRPRAPARQSRAAADRLLVGQAERLPATRRRRCGTAPRRGRCP